MIAYRKRQPYLSLVNSYIIDSPQPSSLNYWYNLGSLLGLCLVIQIASGIFLAMHYSSHIELAFDSVEHIMRDVNLGWLIRYIHANGASFFFACMYIHIGKALYYGSYRKPRVLVWIIGVIILIATIATGFMGYCLVYGQMSHWGKKEIAWNVVKYNKVKEKSYKCISRFNINNYTGPLNINIISIIYGSLLGDAHAEKRKGGKGTRILFYQEGSHSKYLLYLHNLISSLGYSNTNIPKIKSRIVKRGKIKQIIRFHTWTYLKFNNIYNEWYNEKKEKRVPKSIYKYLTPLALAIWIMNDGVKVGSELKLITNSFIYSDVLYLIEILYKKYNLKCSIQKTGNINQYNIYILKESMKDLIKIVDPYIIKCMKYKIIIN